MSAKPAKPKWQPPEARMRCRQTATPCKWPRCDCPVDIVYATGIFIPRPNRK